jgi:hypothetical protein
MLYSMMKTIDIRLFIALFFAFIAATVIGTVAHECGHYLVAKYLGYDAEISYAYSDWQPTVINLDKIERDNLYILLGGPVQTLLTGTTGFILLLFSRHSFTATSRLSARQWAIIFLSLFWLRPTANMVIWVGAYLLTGYFSSKGDEIGIANYLELPNWTIACFTAVIGAIILAIVVFKFIPQKQRFTFIISGLAGGVTGYLLWIVWFGKYIMP